MAKAATEQARNPRSESQEGPRSRKGEQTRARLIEAARAVFERDGFLTARISDIAATAGLSSGSFYHYFDAKEQIFREVAEAQERRLTAPAEEFADTELDGSVWATIRRNNRLYLERYRQSARLMGVIEQVSRYDEQVSATRAATQRHYADHAERTVRGMQRQGRVDKTLDARITADALSTMLRGFAEQWLVQGYREYDFDEVVDQLTILCVNALGAANESQEPLPHRVAAASQ